MTLDEFQIGKSFYCGGKQYFCTDVGSRVAVAIPASVVVSRSGQPPQPLSDEEAKVEGWLDGPPYAVAEVVFDETDQEACTLEPDDDQG